MSGTHSRLSASGAERWMNCPGSIALIKHTTDIIGTDDDSEYSKEGTAAHALAARCLETGAEPWEFTGEKIEDVVVSDDMVSAVQVYSDFCRQISGGASSVYIETQLDGHGKLHPDFGGTADFIAMEAGRWLHVVDYKHGQGLFVEVENNPQLLYYAAGALVQLSGNIPGVEVRISVVQPRCRASDGNVIRTWTLPAEDVMAWLEHQLLPAMKKVDTPQADLRPGEWCRFCPARIGCPVLRGMAKAAALAPKDGLEDISTDALAAEYEKIGPVKMYLRAIEGELLKRLSGGETHGAVKLVEKRADRVWKPEALDILTSRFGEEAFTEPKIKSPAEVEKMPGGKEIVKEYAYKPVNGYSLAPAADKRPAVSVKTDAEVFAAVDKATAPE